MNKTKPRYNGFKRRWLSIKGKGLAVDKCHWRTDVVG